MMENQLQNIPNRIHTLRGENVMLDFDLAELYEIETKMLNRAVKRNIRRFPPDFMFQLTKIEWESMWFQIGTTYPAQRPKTYLPYAFTEPGVAQLSTVLHSDKAIDVNISIIRAFVLMRRYALSHKDLTAKLIELENKYDTQFKDVYEALDYLLNKDKVQIQQAKRKKIGYKKA